MFGARRPDLLAIDHEVITVPDGRGTNARRIRAAGRLSHPESLQPQRAGCDIGKIGSLLFFGAMPQQCPHDVHLRMACGPVPARAMHGFKDRRGFTDAKAGATVFFRDQTAEIARVRQRLNEVRRIAAFTVQFAPVFTGEIRAQSFDAVTDRLYFFCVVLIFHRNGLHHALRHEN